MKRSLFVTLIAVLVLSMAPAVFAATATGNVAATATVSANCTVATSSVAFGTYDPVATNATTDLTATGAVNVRCTKGATTTIQLGQGLHAAGGSSTTVPLRQMLSPTTTDNLRYFLYQDAGHLTVWGDTVGTAVSHNSTTAATTAVNVYGVIPSPANDGSNTNVVAGAATDYADTVLATINF
jgi:spore coat protein U-like protein